MKGVKLMLFGAAAIFVIVWAMSLLFPSTVRVSRAINIHASKETILGYLRNVRQWPAWNEMVRVANGIEYVLTDTSFTNAKTSMRITAAQPDWVRVLWVLKNGKRVTGGFTLYAGSDNTITAVQWYMDFNLRWYPWEKIGSIVFDRQLGPVMEKSLDNLKSAVEQRQ